jgi:UDP-GlcNAc:undecaprenyl-phosphate GlcNAc-1-phosphate transferase
MPRRFDKLPALTPEACRIPMAWWSLYALIVVAAFACSAALCGAARSAGLRLGLMDRPAGRKAHARPVALTGGWGIYLTFAGMVGAGTLLAGPLAGRLPAAMDAVRPYLLNVAGVRGQVLAVLGGATLVFIVGAIDDLRPLGPWAKLAAQFVATVPLLLAGIAIRGFLPDPLGWALTIGWVIVITNAFNLLDNMDGLSASVAAVACIVMALAALQGGQLWMPALFLCLAGALAGFLIYNFHPATLFMGDAGSLTVGYLVAVFSILVTYYQAGVPSSLPVLMPLAIMGVPLFDTLSVMFIRWREGRPLMVGDRNHFSHRLLAMGFTVRESVLTIAALTGATGLLALALRQLAWPGAIVHLAGLILLFAVIVALEVVGRRRS